MASKRMTANPARPIARYRPGKAPVGRESSDEDEESEPEPSAQPARRKPLPPSARRPQATSNQQNSDDDEAGFGTDEEFEPPASREISEGVLGREELPSKASALTSTHSEVASSEEEEEDTESSEEQSSEEESSSDEAPQRKFQRPTFIKKSAREASVSLPAAQHLSRDLSTPQPLSTASIQDDTIQRRKVETEDLIKNRIEQENLARQAGKKSWDDDDEEPNDVVDDTDGLDPVAEHAAWKLRELKRLKRDREKLEAEEREREERERRENMTVEEREKEDAERIARQKDDKEANRGDNRYLQRYHHKGAFFQGDEVADTLRQRKIMGARFEDEVDKERLPEFMQIRDMTKLGKKGRTRHRDLRSDDTGAFGRDVMRWRPGDSNRDGRDDGIRGVDERFMPDRDMHSSSGPTGANASATQTPIEVQIRIRAQTDVIFAVSPGAIAEEEKKSLTVP